jgi:cyanophycinase
MNPYLSHDLPFAPPQVLLRPSAVLLGLAVLLGALTAARSAEPAPAGAPTPPIGAAAGSLVIAGGGSLPDAVRDRFLELAGGKDSRIVVIPTASGKAETPRLLKTPASFRAAGAAVTVLHARSRAEADDPAFVQPLTEATGVWFTGGAQSRLIHTYRGTAVERELQKLLARGGVIGGTSAGAAVMSQVMILGGTTTATVGTGFGFLQGVVVDQHFLTRHRLGRLLGVLAEHPQFPGLGVDEQTAIEVHGAALTVVGNSTASVCLPSSAGQAARVRVLKPGERIDLAALAREVLGRPLPAPARAKPGAPEHTSAAP